MFHPEIAIWEIAARTLLIYAVVFVGLRVSGKRELGQMTAFDLVVILLVANAVQNSMVGPDTSVTGGVVATGVLLLASAALALLRERVPWLRHTIEGSPTVLIHDGQFVTANMRREGIDTADVMMALREHGLDDPAAVRTAILETDGAISVVPASADELLRTQHRLRQRRRD